MELKEQLMSTRADLLNAVAVVGSDVDTVGNEVAQVIAILVQAQQAGDGLSQADLDDVVTKLQATHEKAVSTAAMLTTAINAPPSSEMQQQHELLKPLPGGPGGPEIAPIDRIAAVSGTATTVEAGANPLTPPLDPNAPEAAKDLTNADPNDPESIRNRTEATTQSDDPNVPKERQDPNAAADAVKDERADPNAPNRI